MGYLAAIVQSLAGKRFDLPTQLTSRWPELGTLRYRRGGLPPRIGGWFLGQTTVVAITLGKTIFLAPGAQLDPELLLHE
ncbi:MAG TPA: hypothetical protein VHM24_12660, partial [Gemmatimonadaceae bacterium]|nr:hypothetical protein [Gemmatimonadaceae bacterium]